MKQILSTTLVIAMLILVPMKHSFAGIEPFVGEITLFPGNYAPRDFAFCEGQILNINQNQILFSILGSKYGGDGRRTFALPNLKDAEKSLNGVRYIIALKGLYPPRN